MERVLVPVAMLIATVSLVGGIVWLVRHFEKKRTEALRAVAAAMGSTAARPSRRGVRR